MRIKPVIKRFFVFGAVLLALASCTKTESFARTTDQGGTETSFRRETPSVGANLTLDLATTGLMAALLLGGVAAISQAK